MKKPQWIAAGIAVLVTAVIYFFTQDNIFGYNPKQTQVAASASPPAINIDTILHHAKESLTPEQALRVTFLENSISRGDVKDQKTHLYHQLARFWGDSARMFEPYAWYTAEAARLENSEKSLTFAAQLFLNNLRREENQQLKHWKALQAKDLFERSLKINPVNDSAQVSLGVVYLYGNIADNPMEGILRIRQVAEKDSSNVYAQLSLGQASLISGQLDKAVERFIKVVQLQPQNLEAMLSLADVYERMGDKKQAIFWYNKSLSFIPIPELKDEVEKRILELSK